MNYVQEELNENESLWTRNLIISSSLVLLLNFYLFNFKVGVRNTGITSILHLTCCPDPCYEHVSWYTSNTFLQIGLLFCNMTSLSIRSHVLKRITSQSMLVTTLGFSLDTCSPKSIQDVSLMASTPARIPSEESEKRRNVFLKNCDFFGVSNSSIFAKRVTAIAFCVDNPPHIMHQKYYCAAD